MQKVFWRATLKAYVWHYDDLPDYEMRIHIGMDEIRQYKERLHIALAAAKICIFEVDLIRQLYTYFENAETIFGVSDADILKDVQPFCHLEPEAYRVAVSRYFSHPDDEGTIERAFTNVLRGNSAVYEARMKAGGSGYIWCRIHATPILENGIPVRMVGVVTDISDLKEQADSLKKAVNLDPFTGLYNKEYAITLINRILKKDSNLKHALIVLDIDNFKSFNDTFGHDKGDKVIKAVAQKIKSTFRKSDIVGRFGGDEFIIFSRDVQNAQWLHDKFSDLIRFEVEHIVCTNSIGVSFFPQNGTDFNELFKKADTALYRAKEKKEEFVIYKDI